jgi:putative oxidoreductase
MRLRPHTIFQVLFGVVLLVFVAMGVLGWQPPPVLAKAEPLRDAIFASGYIIPSILIVYFISGASFVSNRFVPMASVILFPVSLNILLFHAVLNPTGRSVAIASALFVANVYMLYQARAACRPLLRSQN